MLGWTGFQVNDFDGFSPGLRGDLHGGEMAGLRLEAAQADSKDSGMPHRALQFHFALV